MGLTKRILRKLDSVDSYKKRMAADADKVFGDLKGMAASLTPDDAAGLAALGEELRILAQVDAMNGTSKVGAFLHFRVPAAVRAEVAELAGFARGMMPCGVYGYRPKDASKVVGPGPMVPVFSPDMRNILLERRIDTGEWGTFGGGLMFGETFEQAALREVREETGGLELEDWWFACCFSDPAIFPTFVYPNGQTSQGIGAIVVGIISRDRTPAGSEESYEVGWHAMAGVDRLPMHAFHRQVISYALQMPREEGLNRLL